MTTPAGAGADTGTGSAAPVIAVLDYGIGNLRSAQKALQCLGAEAHLTADPATIEAANGMVLPGVGSFGRCMTALADAGLAQRTRAAAGDGRPFLGICVGMQMLFEGSEESPGVPGLGVVPGCVRRLTGDVKVPQMQWNVVTRTRPSPLLDHLVDPTWAYFVHSYAVDNHDDAVATCDYGGPVVAAVARGPVHALQFHPEKSGAVGLSILGAFVELCR